MTKILNKKLLLVWVAISVVLIAVGIVMMSIFGFNTSPDYNSFKSFEVEYDSLVGGELESALETLCEDAFEAKGVSPVNFKKYDLSNGNYLEYTFRDSVSADTLLEVKESVEKTVFDENGRYAAATITVSVHTVQGEAVAQDAIWRGALGVGIGAIVAVIYLLFRVGVSRALVALIGAVHDGLLVVALLAILRIPVYGFAPLLYAAIAAFVSVALWTLTSVKMRENFKEEAYRSLSATDAVASSVLSSLKTVLITVCTAAVVLIVTGAALMISGVGIQLGLSFITAILALAVCTYSSLVLLPAVYAPWKAANDKRKAEKRGGYKKKEKAEKLAEPGSEPQA